MKSNRNKSNENKAYKNKIVDINKKMNDNQNIIDKDKKNEIEKDKDDIDIDSPEELHYFMVNMTINYKYLTENF